MKKEEQEWIDNNLDICLVCGHRKIFHEIGDGWSEGCLIPKCQCEFGEINGGL